MTTLEEQIQAGRHEISADTISMSISELTSLFREGTLIIRPEFQRLFRWNPDQKSRLVESLLLGIPLPSLFVSQDEDGRWELVDGLQRVSTLLELQGLLLAGDGTKRPELILRETRYLPNLDGKSWSGRDALSEAQKRDLRLSRLDIRVIKRSSDSSAKFDLFQRLNSFGSTLTPQEIRTALIAGVSSNALQWLHGLTRHPSFIEGLALSERQIEEQYDIELLLRFLMLHNRKLEGKRGGLGDFPSKLDAWSLSFAENFTTGDSALESVFKTSFDFLAEHGSDRVFRKWDEANRDFRGGFSNTSFEVIALGTGYLIANGEQVRSDVLPAAEELWRQLGSVLGTVTGMATGDRFAKTIPFGRQLMAGR